MERGQSGGVRGIHSNGLFHFGACLMWEGEGFSLLVNFGFISLAVKLKTCACGVCAFVCVCLFLCVFWLWFRRGLFSACEEVQEGEDVFGSSSSWLWLPCRGGHYLGHILCVRMYLLLVMELCLSAVQWIGVCMNNWLLCTYVWNCLDAPCLPVYVCERDGNSVRYNSLCISEKSMLLDGLGGLILGGVMARWWGRLWGEIERGSLSD